MSFFRNKPLLQDWPKHGLPAEKDILDQKKKKSIIMGISKDK